MFRALQNVTPSHLADRNLFDFAAVGTQEMPFEGGDLAFDIERPTQTIIPLRRVDAA